MVLAGDVFYQRELAELALRFLRAAAGAGADVLVADPGRAFVPADSLTALDRYQVPVLTAIEDAPVKSVTIYRLSAVPKENAMTESSTQTESGTVTKVSPRPVAATVDRLTELVASKGMKLFAVIDQRAEAEQAGLELRETVLVLFGSPAAGTPVMDAAPLAALDLPLKVLIWDDGGQPKVTYTAPETLAARYGLTPELTARLAGIGPLTDALVAP